MWGLQGMHAGPWNQSKVLDFILSDLGKHWRVSSGEVA